VKEEAAAAEEAAKKNKSFFLFLLLIYAFIRCPSLQRPLSAFVYKCISGVGNTKKIIYILYYIFFDINLDKINDFQPVQNKNL